MTSIKNAVYLVAVLLVAVFAIASVSALGTVDSVQVNGVDVVEDSVNLGNDMAVFAGQTIPIRVVFSADENASDVRVKAWISGSREYTAASERFDVIEGRVYSRLLSLQAPTNIDPSEDITLYIDVESKNGGLIHPAEITLTAQRESYVVDFLSIDMDSQVKAGSTVSADIVLKNMGRHEAEDTFVRATIPALGVVKSAYFSDLSPVDQTDPDKEDAAERIMSIKIPSQAPAGIYVVEFEAFNADSSTTVTKKVAVVGASEDTTVVSSAQSKTFAAGSKATYSVTLVNSGSNVRVYELVVDAPTSLKVSADESVVAIPAGSSKTVNVEVSASKAGKYPFSVSVSSDGELVKTQDFVANVEGSSGVSGSDTTVILTIVLAVIFVVLLVVLIVLLTRKPEKKEEFGESYY